MTIGVNNYTQSWELIRRLATGKTGDKDISDAELQNILKEADKNKDGLIQQQEFKDAFMTVEEYLKLQEEYLKAFEEIASFDGDKTSISASDIENAIKPQETPVNEEVPGSSGPTSPSSDKPDKTDTPSPDSLKNKELPELKSERSKVLTDLRSKKNEKTQALTEANNNVNTAKKQFDDNTKAFSDLLSKKLEAKEDIGEYGTAVIEYQDAKTAVNSKITEQQTAIDTTNENINTIKGQISSLSEPPKELSYFNEETQKTETKPNPAYDEYLKEKERLEDELAAAEAELITQEKEMDELEADLADVENSLKLAIDAYCEAQKAEKPLSQEEIELKSKIDESKTAYDNANKAKKEIESKYDTEIDKLEESVIAYNDAIQAKELTLPEGYSVKDGKITNGKNNLLSVTKDQLPDGYTISPDGKSIMKGEEIVGFVTGETDNPQLYLTEEIEEDTLTYSSKYVIAKQLFEDSLKSDDASDKEIWSDFAKLNLSSSELKEIQDLYDGFASDYNLKLKEGETKAGKFIDQASKKFSKTEEEKATLDAITGAIKRAEFKDSIQPKTFASYLEKNNIDVLNSSDEEMNELLEKFMTEKYGSSNLSKYYPKLTEIQLAEFLGENGLSSLEGIDEKGAFEKIEAILNSEDLSPYEQMSLLKSMKSSSDEMNAYFEKYFKEDDSYFYKKLNEMLTAENEDKTASYSPADLIEFITQYKNLDDKSSALNSDSENLKTLLSVYEAADDKENLALLDSYLSSSVVANLVVQNLDEEEVNAYLPVLFKASASELISEDGSLSLKPADWGLTDEKASSINEKYINADGTTSEKINKVLEDLQSGVIDKSSAQYAVSALLGGKPENLSDIQAKTSVGNISELFGLFNSKPYDAFSPDIKVVSQYVENDGEMPYLLIGPENVDPNEKLPVLVYLHGSGEIGDGKAGLESVGPGKIIPNWNLENFNGYIICPTLSGKYESDGWDNKTTEQYIRDIVKNFESTHNVDTEKVFIGGHSLGAKGAVYMAEHGDDLFSKAFILSGYKSKNGSYNAANVNIPMIGFTGKQDTDSSLYMNGEFASAKNVEYVKEFDTGHGGVPEFALTMDANGNNISDLIEWLLGEIEY